MSAALEAEYAGNGDAGTMARFDPVLELTSVFLIPALAESSFHILYEAARRFAEQVRKKSMRQSYETRKIDAHFLMESLEINSLWFGEIVPRLYSCVDEHTVELWLILCNSSIGELALPLRNMDGASFFNEAHRSLLLGELWDG